jgi:16S rRNA (cytosine967-C5)-methyltransferase
MVGAGTPVVAHDIRASALDELKARADRAGVTTIRVAPKVEGEFDAVLVDAPCSGSGTWRRSPHLKWQTTRLNLATFASRQFELLKSFAAHVRPGGRLVYATCSLAATENERVVEDFLAADPRFAAATPGPNPNGATLLPSVLDSDGFFVSVMRANS